MIADNVLLMQIIGEHAQSGHEAFAVEGRGHGNTSDSGLADSGSQPCCLSQSPPAPLAPICIRRLRKVAPRLAPIRAYTDGERLDAALAKLG